MFEPGSPTAGPQKRQRKPNLHRWKRSAVACEQCRLRKIRYDNVWPACGFCRRNGAPCSFLYGPNANDFSSFDPASLAILDRVNHVLSLLENLLVERVEAAGPMPQQSEASSASVLGSPSGAGASPMGMGV